ncbi:DegT/DnrJ/EryC1/StrS family aminotransferase [Thermoactinospora rubra]|uniref:DegT/DnrJ/EryC1/StrS family aminotransferase n=1 Tax=Thermoactinospora rubra TaxID=1088767 RepID=UPI000A1104B5|nr:DegT/DnrJ/EryC1/StrS family aminotransferase [Thermoactinospora rubra]
MPTSNPVRARPWPSWPRHDAAEAEALRRVVESGEWNGVDAPAVLAFERAYAEFLGAEHVVTCTNGTVSLEIAMAALGIGSGDEVIVPPYTFLATASAVLKVNALPVFADIDPDTYCIDPDAVEAAIGPNTTAVIAVHFAGHPADLDRLRDICSRHGLALIEDSAHAHGASWKGQAVGTFGEFGSWSFQGSKNLTGGEGGALSTGDARLAATARELRNCGRRPGFGWYDHFSLGGNWRLTAFQAAVLSAGLARLPEQIARREACAELLDRELAELPGIVPLARDPRTTAHAHHLYAFRYRAEEFGGPPLPEFCQALQEHGIPATPGYPRPLPRQPLFAERNFDVAATGWRPEHVPTRYAELDLPVCERACAETVWLPHNLLLAEPEEMWDVVTAVALVRKAKRTA